MIKLSNNKKGFTLIELLAVIVILAILVMLAIPMVTRYLTQARKGTYVDNAREAINAVRNDIVTQGFSSNGGGTFTPGTSPKVVYSKDQINKLLEKQLTTSPFGPDYSTGSYIIVTPTNDNTYKYEICLTDTGKNGIELTEENNLKDDDVKIGNATECTTPS